VLLQLRTQTKFQELFALLQVQPTVCIANQLSMGNISSEVRMNTCSQKKASGDDCGGGGGSGSKSSDCDGGGKDCGIESCRSANTVSTSRDPGGLKGGSSDDTSSEIIIRMNSSSKLSSSRSSTKGGGTSNVADSI
jgi:hypothetical protein